MESVRGRDGEEKRREESIYLTNFSAFFFGKQFLSYKVHKNVEPVIGDWSVLQHPNKCFFFLIKHKDI